MIVSKVLVFVVAVGTAAATAAMVILSRRIGGWK